MARVTNGGPDDANGGPDVESCENVGPPPTASMALRWWNHIEVDGAEKTIQRIQSYYDKVAIIGALMAAGAFSAVTNPPDDAQHAVAQASAALGAIAFAGYTFVTILSILISNSLRMIPVQGNGEAQFRGIIQRYQHVYRKPEFIFLASSICVIGQLYTYLYVVYGLAVLVVSSVAVLCPTVWLLSLYCGCHSSIESIIN